MRGRYTLRNYQAKSVDDYIANAPEGARPKLREARAAVRAAVPEAEEGISWGVPFYRHHGLLAGFAAFRDHVSFGLSDALPGKVREALEGKGYATGKKTVQIRFDQEVPAGAIAEILRAKARANEAKRAKR